jgi:hypothetical protein
MTVKCRDEGGRGEAIPSTGPARVNERDPGPRQQPRRFPPSLRWLVGPPSGASRNLKRMQLRILPAHAFEILIQLFAIVGPARPRRHVSEAIREVFVAPEGRESVAWVRQPQVPARSTRSQAPKGRQIASPLRGEGGFQASGCSWGWRPRLHSAAPPGRRLSPPRIASQKPLPLVVSLIRQRYMSAVM